MEIARNLRALHTFHCSLLSFAHCKFAPYLNHFKCNIARKQVFVSPSFSHKFNFEQASGQLRIICVTKEKESAILISLEEIKPQK